MKPHLVINKLQNNLPLLRYFNKHYTPEDFSIILEFSYFYINEINIHQIKGNAMRIKFTVFGSNLVVTYNEMTTFALLPLLYAQDFVDFFIHKLFHSGTFHTGLENISSCS